MNVPQKYRVGDVLEFKTDQGVQRGRVCAVATASWGEVKLFVRPEQECSDLLIHEKQVIKIVRRAWQQELPGLRTGNKKASAVLH